MLFLPGFNTDDELSDIQLTDTEDETYEDFVDTIVTPVAMETDESTALIFGNLLLSDIDEEQDAN